MQAEKTEITERVSKIVFIDARLSETVASWQGDLLIETRCKLLRKQGALESKIDALAAC